MDTVGGFILSEEPFKFKPFEKTPTAERDTAILLYRECMGMNTGMVILPEQAVLSSIIRMGKYDRKIVVDISKRQMDLDMKIRTKDGYCDFLIHIDIEYGIRDVKYAVSNNLSHIKNTIQDDIRKYMNAYQGMFRIEEGIELERKADELTNALIKKFVYLNIDTRTKIALDQIGQKVYESNAQAIAHSIMQGNELEIQRLNMQRKGELERIGYVEKRKTFEEKNRLDMAKLEKLQELKKHYGGDALLVNAYLNDEMSSIGLNEQIRRQQQEDEDRRYTRFQKLYEMDVMTDELTNSYACQSIFGTSIEAISVKEREKEVIEQREEVEIEDGEEIGNYIDDGE